MTVLTRLSVRFAALLIVGIVLHVSPCRADEPGTGAGNGAGTGTGTGTGAAKPVPPVSGAQVYQAVCQSCHMANGKGATGAATIPALADNPNVGNIDYIVTIIRQGRNAMPWLSDVLDQTQIAAVATYVRTHFGNHYPDIVTPKDVAKIPAPPHTVEP